MKEQVIKYNDCDYRCYLKGVKSRKGTVYDRVFCGKVDPNCGRAVRSKKPAGLSRAKPVSKPVLIPMPKLPPLDTRPKRFYKDREYIGITFKKEEHGEWIESLSIKRLMGRPYNVYDYKVTIEYNQPMWDALIKRIKSEATVYGREAIVKPGYAYTVARIISRPMKRSWVRLEPHEWRATDFPGGNSEYLQKLSGRAPWELSLSQYIDAFMIYHKPDWVSEGEAALKLAEKQWKEAIKKEIPTGRVHPVVLKEYEKMAPK